MAIEQILKEFKQDMARQEREFLEQANQQANRFEQKLNRNFVATLTTLSAMVVIVTTLCGVLLHFSFVH